ncbi:MAG: alpha/beta hydrolase [Pirellulales bacterium]
MKVLLEPVVAILMMLLCVSNVAAQPQAATFDSAGVPIRYEISGSGEPVVLIHGFLVNGQANWSMGDIINKLNKSFQVIVIDVRGHGRSGKPHDVEEYGFKLVEDVDRLLDHLKIDKAHIAGYSMGGLITMKMAMERPQRILSASVCAAGWLRPDQEEAPEFIEAVASSLENGNGPLPLLERLNPSPDAATQARIKATNAFLKSANDTKALAAAIRSFPKLAVTEQQIVDCKVPVQVLIGTADPAPTSIEQLKSVAPSNFKIVEIKNADHMSTIAAPLFSKNLLEFIEQN